MDFSLETPQRHHLDQIIELLQSVSSFVPATSEMENIWCRYLEQPHCVSVVALDGTSVIGFASIFFATRIRGGKVGYVEDVVVNSRYRNLGIGSSLLDFLHSAAKHSGCFKISLQSSEKNLAFYEKKGYRPKGASLQRQMALA